MWCAPHRTSWDEKVALQNYYHDPEKCRTLTLSRHDGRQRRCLLLTILFLVSSFDFFFIASFAHQGSREQLHPFKAKGRGPFWENLGTRQDCKESRDRRPLKPFVEPDPTFSPRTTIRGSPKAPREGKVFFALGSRQEWLRWCKSFESFSWITNLVLNSRYAITWYVIMNG